MYPVSLTSEAPKVALSIGKHQVIVRSSGKGWQGAWAIATLDKAASTAVMTATRMNFTDGFILAFPSRDEIAD